MKIESWKIVMSLLVISCFSYGDGAAQYIARMFILPLVFALSLHFAKYKLMLKTIIGILPIFAIIILTMLIVYNYFINQTSTKAFWKFLELLLLFGTLWNLSQLINRINLHVYSLLDYIFLNLSVICIFSIILEFTFGNQKVTELSGHFPIINANGVGTIFGAQVLYFMSRGKVTLATITLLMTILSGSMAALIAIILSTVCFIIIKALPNLRGITRNWKICALGSVGILVLYWIIDLVPGDIKRLSGRTEIWQKLFVALNDSLGVFNGVGYGYVRTVVGIETRAAKTLHNSYLEVLFSIGYLGFLSYIIFNLFLIMKLNKIGYDLRIRDTIFMILMFLLIKSLTTSNLVYLSPELVLYGAVLLSMSRILLSYNGRSSWVNKK